MALEENTGGNMVMPVGPMYSSGGGNSWGGDWGSWIILFLLFGMFGGWGNGNGQGFGGGGLYPWMNQSNQINDGFRDQMMNTTLVGIQNAVTNGFGNAEIAACNRAMADLERSFAAQTASTQGMTALQAQLAQCCCDNRQATSDLRYTIAQEACADRATVNEALRDVLAANTASTQRILDQLCADKIDQKNQKIADLERQLTMLNLAASQNAQTATILANNEAQTTALEQYLAPTPRPAYVVQNPNCCTQNYGCGCGTF